jgi:hypothetical protein
MVMAKKFSPIKGLMMILIDEQTDQEKATALG